MRAEFSELLKIGAVLRIDTIVTNGNVGRPITIRLVFGLCVGDILGRSCSMGFR